MIDTEDLVTAMKQEFGDDQRRIGHALAVLSYAERILDQEGGRHNIVIASAILHDIGIQDAERKHGSSAPKYQEMEGPPIAKRILKCIRGLDSQEMDHVCRIVGSHHSAHGIDSLEFKIVWDADWLVNFRDVYPCEFGVDCKTQGKQCLDRITRIFRTETGRSIAMRELIPEFVIETSAPVKR